MGALRTITGRQAGLCLLLKHYIAMSSLRRIRLGPASSNTCTLALAAVQLQ